MIVTCPGCGTRYLAEDAALGGAAGRRVRCASCGNMWHYSPADAAISQAIADATAAAEAAAIAQMAASEPAAASMPSNISPTAQGLRAEPDTGVQALATAPSAAPRPSVAVELPAAARRRQARLGGLALVALAIGAVVVAIFARGPIVDHWPAAAPVYAMLHLSDPPGAGLAVTVTPTRTPDSLVITGDIVNDAKVVRRIPRLRVTLRDGNKADLDSQLIDPPVASLAPGASAHFDTTFKHPSITATGVVVTFAQD